MRTIGPHSNILVAIASAFGVIAALDRPWYGPSARPTDARMEDMFGGVARAFSDPSGASGWEALRVTDRLLAGLAAATVALLVLSFVPALRTHVHALARWSSFAALGVVLFALVHMPGGHATSEPRNGLLIAVGAAGVLMASTLGAAVAPVRRPAPARTYTPPPAPVYAPDGTYGPP